MFILRVVIRDKMIGFLAKRKRGKDAACDYISSKYGYIKRGFADPLKLGVQQWFHFSDEQLFTELKEEEDKNWGLSPRRVCQVIGTDVVRDMFSSILLPNIGNDFWVKSADVWYEKNKYEKVVWCDVRFQNEVDYILSKGGRVFKIERPDLDKNVGNKIDEHASEKSVDDIQNYSGVIVNDGLLEDFYLKLDGIFA